MRLLIYTAFLLFAATGYAQPKTSTSKALLPLVQKSLTASANQYLYFCSQVPDSLLPRSTSKNGSLITSKSDWWCSGFYPGTLLYLYEATGNDSLYREAKRKLILLKKEKSNTSTHDLGFIMYCSFGNAEQIAPGKHYEEVLLQSARSLASRYSPVTHTIRSWNSKNPKDYLVIIDNMMNLELLFYATKISGDSSFYKIAVSHADRTMQQHFRPDFSSYHVVNYNAETGEVQKKRTQQGANDSSAWARGQAWGLYGYTLMYRETGDPKYLEQANNIATYILNHPNLPADKVPYWDYNAPGIPTAYRDASAGAVMASAFLELSTYAGKAEHSRYFDAASTIIKTLSGKNYLANKGTNGGFLLQHSVGNIPENSEIDTPLTYADYYYVEALIRYKKMADNKPLFADTKAVTN